MSATKGPDNVSMEFAGPVPGVLGPVAGYHVVFWVQAGGGAGFTRPSQEERDYYAETGKPVPEWQCEYFEFDGLTWSEAALSIELWRGSSKLRSLFAAAHTGRNEADLRKELPELERFLDKHGLSGSNMASSFHEALLCAAEAAKVIQRGVVNAKPRSSAATQVLSVEHSWWRRSLRRLWPRRAI
jgi:hypothetical protein